MNGNDNIGLAAGLSIQANKLFVSQNAELLAAFDMPSVWRSIAAWLQLEGREMLEDQRPSLPLYLSALQRAFVECFDDGVVQPQCALSPLGSVALNELRRATGVGLAALPVPVVEPTVEERLEQEIIHDWATLSGDAIRKKRDGNRQYRQILEKLLQTDRLNTQVTASVVMH